MGYEKKQGTKDDAVNTAIHCTDPPSELRHLLLRHWGSCWQTALSCQTPAIALAEECQAHAPFAGGSLADDWLTSGYKHCSSPGLSPWTS